MERLVKLRHHRLAHRQVTSSAPEAPPDERDIEDFYRANTRLIEILSSLVNAVGYNVEDGAGVYRYYANFFWAAARGEQTEGHPDYRKPLGDGNTPARMKNSQYALFTPAVDGDGVPLAEYAQLARASKFRTVLSCQSPPRAVRTPRSLSA